MPLSGWVISTPVTKPTSTPSRRREQQVVAGDGQEPVGPLGRWPGRRTAAAPRARGRRRRARAGRSASALTAMGAASSSTRPLRGRRRRTGARASAGQAVDRGRRARPARPRSRRSRRPVRRAPITPVDGDRAGRPARRAPGCSPRSRRAGWRGWRPSPSPSAGAVAGGERRDELVDPRVLGDHVAGPPADDRVGRCASRSPSDGVARADRSSACGRPGRPRPARRRRSSASCSPLPGVDDHDLEVVGERHRAAPSSVVQSIRRAWPSTPAALTQLVHDPARHAGRPLLGPLARAGPASSGGALEARAPAPPPPRGRPTTTGPRRSGAWCPPSPVEPGRRPQLGHHAGDVARPRRARRRPDRRRRAARRPARARWRSASSTTSPPRVARSTVVPRSMAIGSTRPPVWSVWSPIRFTRPGRRTPGSSGGAQLADRLGRQVEERRAPTAPAWRC